MKIAIVGSRGYQDNDKVSRELDALLSSLNVPIAEITIVSGGAPGVDSIAKEIARERGYAFEEFPADWKKFGRAAGPARNKQIVDNSDRVLAFVRADSKGTRNTVALAKKTGKPVTVVDI